MQFSYEEYRSILKAFEGRWTDFSEDLSDGFVIMRHDVEFSIDRAVGLGIVEHEQGVRSTFNLQVRCETYNVLSLSSKEKIRTLVSLGHNIGLHFYASHVSDHDWDNLNLELEQQRQILESASGQPCDRFSFHRPRKWMLSELRDDLHCGLINQYGSSFFEFSENPTRIKYIADSRHEWSYGHPLEHTNAPRIQILSHPDEWSESGYSEKENFIALKEELGEIVLDAFLEESPKNFRKYVGSL